MTLAMPQNQDWGLSRHTGNLAVLKFIGHEISEEHHGPPSARRYEYDPTYMLRGLRELHLQFTPVS